MQQPGSSEHLKTSAGTRLGDAATDDVSIHVWIQGSCKGEGQARFFFFKVFGGHTCPILGPLVPLFWISGDVSSGFQSQSGLPYSHCGGECNVRSLRSTSGATLADLFAAGVQPVLSPHTVAEVRLPGFELMLSDYM